MYRPKPSDFHPFEAYQDDFVKDFFSLSLVFFAYVNFAKITRIRKFDILSSFVRSAEYKNPEKSNVFIKENPDFATNALLDNILISISFENYFKAKLLQNGFLIHEILNNKNKELFKEQKKQPVDFKLLNFERKDKCSELRETTLNYDLLLHNKEYYKYYNLDSSILKFLEEVNKRRNNLHFYMSETFKFSNTEINNIEKLKKVVDIDFAVLNNCLADKIGGISNSRIIIKK